MFGLPRLHPALALRSRGGFTKRAARTTADDTVLAAFHILNQFDIRRAGGDAPPALSEMMDQRVRPRISVVLPDRMRTSHPHGRLKRAVDAVGEMSTIEMEETKRVSPTSRATCSSLVTALQACMRASGKPRAPFPGPSRNLNSASTLWRRSAASVPPEPGSRAKRGRPLPGASGDGVPGEPTCPRACLSCFHPSTRTATLQGLLIATIVIAALYFGATSCSWRSRFS
jgi:hypothetical protein